MPPKPHQYQLFPDPAELDPAISSGQIPRAGNRYAIPHDIDHEGRKPPLEGDERRAGILENTSGFPVGRAAIEAGKESAPSPAVGINPVMIARAVAAKTKLQGKRGHKPVDLRSESFKVKRMADEPPRHIRRQMGRK